MKRLLETIEGTFAISGVFSLVVISFLAVNQLNPILETPVKADVAGITDVKSNIPILYTAIFDNEKKSSVANVYESESTKDGVNIIVAFNDSTNIFNEKVLSIYNPNNGDKQISGAVVVSDYLKNDLKVTLIDDKDSIVLFDSERSENIPMHISFTEFEERNFVVKVETNLQLQGSQIAMQFVNTK